MNGYLQTRIIILTLFAQLIFMFSTAEAQKTRKRLLTNSLFTMEKNKTIMMTDKSISLPSIVDFSRIISKDKSLQRSVYSKKDNTYNLKVINSTVLESYNYKDFSNSYRLFLLDLVWFQRSDVHLHPLILGNQSSFSSDNSKFEQIRIATKQLDFVDIRKCEIKYSLEIYSDTLDSFILKSLYSTKDSTEVKLVHPEFITRFLIYDSSVKYLHVELIDCDISCPLLIEVNNKSKIIRHGGNLLVHLYNSTLSNSISEYRCTYPSKFVLDNVSFKDKANLTNIGYDSLEFRNCVNFYKPVKLTPDTSNRDFFLSFVDTDVKMIDFNFTERMHLFFDPSDTNDQIVATFENLLAKFHKDGKEESAKNVDVEYTIYKNTRYGLIGIFFSLVSKYWWYYGYKKWLIIWWTLALLLFFFAANLFIWREMKLVYPIINSNHRRYLRNHDRFALKVNQVINVFVFTAFIFFSLRIDFSKISYNRSRLLLMFFVEYLTGLICMFFIVNALLKL